MSYQEIVDDLLASTRSSRATIRLERADDPLMPIVAEALAPGVEPLIDVPMAGMRQVPPFRWLEERLELLVQDDTLAGPAAYEPLAKQYGISAQMLSPLVRDGRLAGFVAVHHVGDEPRTWTAEEIAAIRSATAQALDALERACFTRPDG